MKVASKNQFLLQIKIKIPVYNNIQAVTGKNAIFSNLKIYIPWHLIAILGNTRPRFSLH
jgi:hypothetical protein